MESSLASKEIKASFLEAVAANIYKVSINEEYFKNHTPIAVGEFDGTRESFEIAAGNISANYQLREFGLHSIRRVLDGLEDLFYSCHIGKIHSFAIAFEKTLLCQIINCSPTILSDTVLFLNIADVIDSSGMKAIPGNRGFSLPSEKEDNSKGNQIEMKTEGDQAIDEETEHVEMRSFLLSSGVAVLFLVLAIFSTYSTPDQ